MVDRPRNGESPHGCRAGKGPARCSFQAGPPRLTVCQSVSQRTRRQSVKRATAGGGGIHDRPDRGAGWPGVSRGQTRVDRGWPVLCYFQPLWYSIALGKPWTSGMKSSSTGAPKTRPTSPRARNSRATWPTAIPTIAALKNVQVIIKEWIGTARELDRPIPVPRGKLAYA